jgi:3-oxoacyl-[acyl-carrier-protein] synthase-1
MLNNDFISESAHIEELDPAFDGLPIVREMQERKLNCVLSNSFGFGGTNATLAFTRLAA